MKKDKELDQDTIALIEWCMQVEAQLIERGATREEAQEQIEEQAEWYTDLFYVGYSPEQAAEEAMSD